MVVPNLLVLIPVIDPLIQTIEGKASNRYRRGLKCWNVIKERRLWWQGN